VQIQPLLPVPASDATGHSDNVPKSSVATENMETVATTSLKLSKSTGSKQTPTAAPVPKRGRGRPKKN
jgi:hypothetical protein